MKPRILVTLGDPNGVGPEVTYKSWLRVRDKMPAIVVIGPETSFEAYPRARRKIRRIQTLEQAQGDPERLDFLALPCQAVPTPGRPSRGGAAAILEAIRLACELCLKGQADAMVTAPVHKETLHTPEAPFSGHTAFLAHMCQRATACMMLASPTLRTVPITEHIPLLAVGRHLTPERIEQTAHLTAAALRQNFGLPHPRLVLLGLNPHAGENGTLGEEEHTVMEPALARLRKQGLDIEGPMAADTAFIPPNRKRFDVFLCPTHDQALIPVKLLAFYDTVNITLGLPIVRTSPGHGTAFELAGRDVASWRPMRAALHMAGTLALRNKDARPAAPSSQLS